ncbi:MAG TPA: hypothetical protein VN634_19415 [Candidatus Limnocylindrales bacterium]|nr:hypothetical protein [Candidatus Limnocylindrales bacterium]
MRKTRTILQRWTVGMVVMAMAVAGPAAAAPVDDARALINAIVATGDTERAWQLTQVVDSMSEAELETFANSGIRELTGLMNQQREAIEAARDIGFRLPAEPPSPVVRNHNDDFPLFTDYTPDSTSCPNSPDQTSIGTIVAIRSTLVGAQAAYKIAKALYDDTNPVCHQLVVAIGVGSNPQTAVCIGLGIAETVVHVAFDVTAKALELIDFCDDEVDYAKIRATFHDLEFIHNQLTTHDTDEKLQVTTHDDEEQALLDDLLARLARIEGKLDLLMKSQLEIAMDRRGGRSRPSVFYEDRLDELCGYAQEAVDDLPDVYLVADQCQGLINEGLSLKLTDPKLAADTCVAAFVRATAGSSTLQ